MSRSRTTRTQTARGLAAATVAALLCGCAVSDDKVGALLADPMQYEFYTCQQLAANEAAQKTRLQELDGLMAKSASGAGGSVVNAVAYRPEYVTVTGQLNAVRHVQAEKNCPPPPAPAAPTAPPKPAKPAR